MSHTSIADPFAPYSWFGEAGWVFAVHTAQLWADPVGASARLATLWSEKQAAFAEGAVNAGVAAARGATPEAIAEAAMAPARRRVMENVRKIQNG